MTLHLTKLLLACGLWLAAAAAPAQDAPATATALAPARPEGLARVERVQVADPFIEFHTGPGRGYPVHHVVERGAWVAIELRHTDWYKLRAEGGQVGWVQRGQLLGTLTETGERKGFKDLLLDDYLRRRAEAGAMLGRFAAEPMVRLWAGWRLADSLGVEAAIGQVQGVYAGTSLMQFQLISEPWSDRRLSPFLGVGLGRFHNLPNRSLVDASRTDVNMGLATLGLRYHVAERFIVRLDWTLYTALLGDNGYGEYRSLGAGLSFFF